MAAADRATIRLDKWLVQARFFKTRALASALVEAGRVRLNGQHVAKPAQPVGEGDMLTFPQGGRIRLIRVVAVGARRGPASEARGLYDDLDTPPAAASPLE
ncbi:RNA-binding S4 domain-containing protein [Cereibacter azotoformans]|uniref:Heat shock protein Hsp15 n=1 Tax=Cereibacter azotoformans TaxID=43057 RepID=A0A2T5KD78_9RHOB|nr:RNA-binding S4 domain-containing protein [Cereibacter azotoformans]AXQ93586.1 RNA-binding S4 domain-containing protein [Cereibacter sphaeroides]MBO4168646.1 RNA-binding S4 domain-containing protein [Cereibacter azotoformans]PTR20364.1 heat shock protein Hsp15 [Cereibacter azotoformans]UIJ31924.1 RNA-binding S4 domain-containing protein [Cereibacter azotoformans]